MPRRVLLGLGLLIVLVATSAVTVLWLMTPPPGITAANGHRLRHGMTEVQVEAILGCPGVQSQEDDEDKSYYKVWATTGLEIEVLFDAEEHRMKWGYMTQTLSEFESRKGPIGMPLTFMDMVLLGLGRELVGRDR